MRLLHIGLCSLMLSLGIGCMVAADPSGEPDPAVESAIESRSAGEESVGEGGDAIIVGARCGENVCERGQFCCNASCGICAPKGGACTQQVCEPLE